MTNRWSDETLRLKEPMSKMDKTSILHNNHWTISSFKQRVTRKELNYLLLNSDDTIIRSGRICQLKYKPLGFGVYEIWFEQPSP